MRVRVLYLGMLKEVAGSAQQSVEVPEGSTAGALWQLIVERYPKMKGYERSVALAVNEEFAVRESVLKDGDEVGLLPPVSGGVEASRAEQVLESEHCRIQREEIEADAVMRGIRRPEDGAVSVFDGIVRNNTRGRVTLYLIYEAYEGMALKQMEALAERALADFKIRDVRLVHRLGRLEIGETSVLIVVASAHRAAAMDACRWLIDTLKKKVPIWKKEFFVDGAVWADGEPFPETVARAGDDGK